MQLRADNELTDDGIMRTTTEEQVALAASDSASATCSVLDEAGWPFLGAPQLRLTPRPGPGMHADLGGVLPHDRPLRAQLAPDASRAFFRLTATTFMANLLSPREPNDGELWRGHSPRDP